MVIVSSFFKFRTNYFIELSYLTIIKAVCKMSFLVDDILGAHEGVRSEPKLRCRRSFSLSLTLIPVFVLSHGCLRFPVFVPKVTLLSFDLRKVHGLDKLPVRAKTLVSLPPTPVSLDILIALSSPRRRRRRRLPATHPV